MLNYSGNETIWGSEPNSMEYATCFFQQIYNINYHRKVEVKKSQNSRKLSVFMKFYEYFVIYCPHLHKSFPSINTKFIRENLWAKLSQLQLQICNDERINKFSIASFIFKNDNWNQNESLLISFRFHSVCWKNILYAALDCSFVSHLQFHNFVHVQAQHSVLFIISHLSFLQIDYFG